MAHFRGEVIGCRGEASRLGTKSSGITVVAQSWEGQVRVVLHEYEGVDCVSIVVEPSPAVYGGDQTRKVLFVGSFKEARGG